MRKPTKTPFTEFVDTKLRFWLMVYFVLAVLILAYTIYHIITDRVSALLPFIGLCAGIGVGILAARIYRIAWQEDLERVIGEMDALGAIILVLYVLFDLFRDRIILRFVHGPAVASISFAVLAGVMYGRVLGVGRKLEQILKKQIFE